MAKLQAIIGAVLIATAIVASSAEIPNPSYARTMLKIARSLSGETEEMRVRTNEGNVATLIVKRREKSEDTINQDKPPRTETKVTSDSVGNNANSSNPSATSPDDESAQKRRDEVRRSESAQIEQIRTRSSAENRSSRPEIDSENLKIPENRSRIEITNKPTISRRGSTFSETNMDYGNWTPLNENGRALQSTDEPIDKYLEWKPLASNSKIATDDRPIHGQFRNTEIVGGRSLTSRIFHDREMRNRESAEQPRDRLIGNRPMEYVVLRHEPQTITRTNIGANLSKNRGGKNVPAEVTVRSEINVKSLPKRTPMSLDADGIPVIHGTRVPDEPIDKIQTWRNARVIDNKLVTDSSTVVTLEPSNGFFSSENPIEGQRFDGFFKDVNRRYGRNFEENRNTYFEWDPKIHQNVVQNSEIRDTQNENLRSNLQKRMLHPEGSTNYPNSQLYTPTSQKIAPLALKPGSRTPVLQYAHPELGVQPAKILKTEKRRPDNFPDNQNSFTEQRNHKKKYVLNDKNVVDSYTMKNYYPNQHFYGLKQPNEQPFWVKISENLKNQFSTGVERVSQLTRPVFDPLVEATHKISQNLGLTRPQEAQNKIGTVATKSSILIPALGLVASGAALGIGAVAVGRYLDVDVLKRSQENDEFDDQRAFGAIRDDPREFSIGEIDDRQKIGSRSAYNNEDGVFVIMEKTNDDTTMKNRRTDSTIGDTDRVHNGREKRSVDYFDIFKSEDEQDDLRRKRLRRTGPDSLTEIVEIDVPANGNIGIAEMLAVPRRTIDDLYVVQDSNRYPETKSVMENSVDPDEPLIFDDLVSMESVISEKSAMPDQRRSTRQRRSLDGDDELDDALQNLENAEISEVARIAGDWTYTPCAKRIFCDAMINRGPDDAIFMEKKMDGLLGLIQPGAALQLSSHFQEVMEAVRRHDCSSFLCPQDRPGNVFY